MDGAGGRRDGRTRDTRQRIHALALELFVAQGFRATTMQQIADRLGLTKTAVYYHHPTKADLVRSVIQPAVDDIDAFLEEAHRVPSDRRTLLERFFDLNYTHRLAFLALLRDPSGLEAADAADWVPRLARDFQHLLGGDDAGPWQRIGAVMAANGLSRTATLLTDIPYEELRRLSVAAAMTLLEHPDPSEA